MTVSSLLPRKGGPQLQDKIDCINKELKSLCDVSNCKYIDNDHSFKLFDGAMNDALYCPDGTHLNTLGSSKLIGNLGLMFKTKQKYSKAVINGRPATPKLRDSGLSTRQKSFRHVGFNAFQTDRGEGKCHFCGVTGHMKKKWKYGDYISCFNCGGKGHKSRSCVR